MGLPLTLADNEMVCAERMACRLGLGILRFSIDETRQ